MKVNDYKYIVYSGCSYSGIPVAIGGRMPGLPKLELPFDGRFYHQDNNVIVINCSLSSAGSRWQSDATIYVVNQLLELGINPNNIYSLVSWSELMRLTHISWSTIFSKDDNIIINKEDGEQEVSEINFETKDVYTSNGNSSPILDLLNETLDIGTVSSTTKIGYIDGEYYVTPEQILRNDAPKIECDTNGRDFVSQREVERRVSAQAELWIDENYKIDQLTGVEERVHRYLTDILRTQDFLKSKNIKYNFTFINSQFSHYYKLDTGFFNVYKKELHNFLDIKNFELNMPKLSEENDIEYVYERINKLWKRLDLENIYFHNTDKWRRGGIDEIIIDAFGIGCFCNPDLQGENHTGSEPVNYGLHPRHILYLEVWKKVSTNCDFIKHNENLFTYIHEIFNKDLNSDKDYEFGMTLSKNKIKELWQKKNMV